MMDEDDIKYLIQGCKTLKLNFHGVFAANNFPRKMNRNSFFVVNAATAEIMVLTGYCYAEKTTFVCRSPGSAHFIVHLYQRIITVANNHNIYQLLENQSIQNANSKLCGLFCIYIAHFVFTAEKLVNISNNELIRFDFDMMF